MLEDRINICFLCLGNTCRSPMAEHIAKAVAKRYGKSKLEIYSRGIMEPKRPVPVSPEAVEVLKEKNPDSEIESHHPQRIEISDLAKSDIILTMDVEAKEALQKVANHFKLPVESRIFTLKEYAYGVSDDPNIHDPFRAIVNLGYRYVNGKKEPFIISYKPKEERMKIYRACRDEIDGCVNAIIEREYITPVDKVKVAVQDVARKVGRAITSTLADYSIFKWIAHPEK